MTDAPDPRIVMNHAATMGMTGELLNIAAAYLGAEEGSTEEQAHEDQLEAHLMLITGLGPEAVTSVLLGLASLVVAVAPEAEVQRWFNEQAEHIEEALGLGHD